MRTGGRTFAAIRVTDDYFRGRAAATWAIAFGDIPMAGVGRPETAWSAAAAMYRAPALPMQKVSSRGISRRPAFGDLEVPTNEPFVAIGVVRSVGR